MRQSKISKERKVRLTLDLNESQFERLQELEARAGSTKADVVRDAIRLYDYISERTRQGYSFRAVDPTGKPEKVFFVMA